jgi:hypothetical protein
MYVSSVFHLDVAYVAMAAHTCFKYLFSCVLDVSNLCYKSGSGCCIRCYGYTHMFQEYISNVSSVFSCILQMFHDYVSKVDRGVPHVAMCVGGWRTGACRSCLVLPPRHRRGSRAGVGWAQQAWCYGQGATVVVRS